MNLWHLFRADESYKLDTFLAGGLWCSDLGSIIGFGDDVEGSGLQGIFVSCWHASEGYPTPHAWKIFGGNGDGFAIRTAVNELDRYAAKFDNPILTARFEEVQYLLENELICNPAFQVRGHHKDEAEMRLALWIKEQIEDEDETKKNLRAAVDRECSDRDFGAAIDQLTLSTRADSDFALILPIEKSAFFKEFLIGPGVSPVAKTQGLEAIKQSEIQSPVRVLADL